MGDEKVVAFTVLRSQREDTEGNITREKRNEIFLPVEENEEESARKDICTHTSYVFYRRSVKTEERAHHKLNGREGKRKEAQTALQNEKREEKEHTAHR
jgi:hypothetical protein